jgi:hypothetical protein
VNSGVRLKSNKREFESAEEARTRRRQRAQRETAEQKCEAEKFGHSEHA